MLPVLLLAVALAGAPAEAPAPDKPATPPPPVSFSTDQPALARPSAANPPTFTAPDRGLLMKELQGTWEGALLDGSRMQVSGWIDLGATFGTAPSSNLPLGFNYRDNNFSVQQNWLRIQRTVVTTGTTEPTFGFCSDTILPGTDYRFVLARGLLSNQLTANHGHPNSYGIDPVQFYVEGYFPTVGRGLDVKIGRLYTQYGVESIEAPANVLLSHTHTDINNPFTQTGILATLQATEEWSVAAGLVQGSDVFFDGGDATFIGYVKWALPSGRDSVTLSTILSSARFNQARNLNNLSLIDLVATHKFSSRLSDSFEFLSGYETNVPLLGTTTWFGAVNYLTWDFNTRVSATGRLEFWNDAQGQRTGFRGLYTAITAGLNFRPRKEIIVRPEVRYDYNGESRPFEGQHGLFTVAMDLILRW